jgi:F0F1-type ATP synthase membrane subunit b/b'
MGELLQEVFHGITAAPARFIAELVQSVVLLGVVWWAGRRLVRPRLIERRARIATELGEAAAAERRWTGVGEEVRTILARSGEATSEILRVAREQAQAERGAAIARIDSEAEQVIAQARQTVERDKNRVLRETSDRLIRLATETAKRYLSERLTESERRVLMQKAILASLEELGQGPPPGSAGVT